METMEFPNDNNISNISNPLHVSAKGRRVHFPKREGIEMPYSTAGAKSGPLDVGMASGRSFKDVDLKNFTS